MKKILVVLILASIGCKSFAQEIAKPENPFKISNATEGKKVKSKYYKKAKFQCPDEPMNFKSYPVGPIFENVKDSIFFIYEFEFTTNAKKCLTEGMAKLELVDKDLKIIATRPVSVDQHDMLVRFCISFKDKDFDSSEYFVQLIIETKSLSYVTSLAQLPSRTIQ